MFQSKDTSKFTAFTGADQHFHKLVQDTLPECDALFIGGSQSGRYAVLRRHEYVSDKAYVACVYLYSNLLGKKALPEGVHDWPSVEPWLQFVPEARFELTDAKKAISDADAGDAASSSGLVVG